MTTRQGSDSKFRFFIRQVNTSLRLGIALQQTLKASPKQALRSLSVSALAADHIVKAVKPTAVATTPLMRPGISSSLVFRQE